MPFSSLLSWTHKPPSSNDWHPCAHLNPTTYPSLSHLPPFLQRIDIPSLTVDLAPFIAGAGSLAHLSQLNAFGFTAHANIFRNPRTLLAMHRACLIVGPAMILCQGAGVEYRNVIPRWASERERRRDEGEARMHVDVGMAVGAAVWVLRVYGFRKGVRFWAPVDVVLGGALADLAHREYCKAHGL